MPTAAARLALPAPVVAIVALLGVATAAAAADREPGEPWVVGIKVAEPFAMRDANGDWTGLSVELWRRAADALGVDYEFHQLGLPELLRAVAAGEVDVGLGALTITLERERVLDFTHPFLATGLGVAVPRRAGALAAVRGLFSTSFWVSLGALVSLLLAVGMGLWLVERRRNPQVGRGLRGIANGFWWSAVTMTTVGYGDVAPRTALGRVLGVVWMFAGVILISGFTAAIASSLTVSRLASQITSPEDLARVRVGTAHATAAAAHLEASGIAFRAYPDVHASLDGLVRGEIDAVVYDAPILQHLTRDEFADRAQVLPFTIARQDYALALPPGSPAVEALNRSILETILSPEWGDILRRYLGERSAVRR